MDASFNERAAASALLKVFGFTPKTANALCDALGCAEAVYSLGEGELAGLVGAKIRSKIRRQDFDEAKDELKRLYAKGISFVARSEAAYPALLRDCEDAPAGLYVRSATAPDELFASDRRSLAVVGTRDADLYGLECCERIVRTVAGCSPPCVIVSGLALGIDVRAHRSALDSGIPTIAVLPTGIDSVYPYRHRDIAERIATTPGCALITDYPPCTAPLAVNFIRRNRIIAGLSASTVLVESRRSGGGILTARLASGYGRGVFCVPGRIGDARSEGCNLLIREQLAETISDFDSLCTQLGMETSLGSGKGRRSLAEAIREKYGRENCSLPETIAGLVAASRGITPEELCRETGERYETVLSAVLTLQNDGFLEMDLLQRCCINVNFV